MPQSHSSINTATPRHLWIIGIIALLWSTMGAFDFSMTMTKNEAYMSNFSAEELEFFYSFPTWLIGTWAVGVWGGVFGAVLLLMRKKPATWVFTASFFGALISTIRNYAFSNGLEVMGSAMAIGFTTAILVVALGLVIYSRAMSQRRVLH